MFSWNKESLLIFIENYKSMECLWKIKSKDYSNKFLKDKAYESLVAYCKEFDESVNRDSIIKKINNLRSSFRRELKKQELSKLSCSGADEVYEPKLWYFEHLMFLRDQEIPRESQPYIKPDYSEMNSHPDSPNISVPPSPGQEESATDGEDQLDSPTQSFPSTSGTQAPVVFSSSAQQPTHAASTSFIKTPVTNKSKIGKKRKAAIVDDAFLASARCKLLNTQMTTIEDELDALGKHIVHRLRMLSPMQQIYTKKALNDVLFEAELKEISKGGDYNCGPVRNHSVKTQTSFFDPTSNILT